MPIGETIVTVVGNLTADPELTATADGVTRATFTVASNSRNWDRDRAEWGEGRSLFMRCTAWRWLADNAANSLHKGDRVIVTGALRQFDYTSADNVQRTGYGIDVEDIAASLRYATADITRSSTNGGHRAPEHVPTSRTTGTRTTHNGAKTAPVDDPWATATPAGGQFSDEPPF